MSFKSGAHTRKRHRSLSSQTAPRSPTILEEQSAKRRYYQIQRVLFSMPRAVLGIAAAKIAKAGATVLLRIAVEDFTPITTARNPHSVVMARHRSEIEHRDDDFI